MDTSTYIALEDRYGAHNYHPLDVALCEGEGVRVYDVYGNQYMDCLSAHSALNHGGTVKKANPRENNSFCPATYR